LQICISFIFKIPPPLVNVSGHLPLIQTHHFQILEPLDLNQIWQEFEFGKLAINPCTYTG
jgi:hypothetical protein